MALLTSLVLFEGKNKCRRWQHDDISLSLRTSSPCFAEMHGPEASRAAEPRGAHVRLGSLLTHHPRPSALWPRPTRTVESPGVPHPLPELLHQGDRQRRGGLPLPKAVQCLLHQHRSRRDNPLPPEPLCCVSHTSLISLVTFNFCFLPCVDPPVVSMPDVVKGFYMQPAVIGCSVESDIPYRLRFTRNGITLGEERSFQWVCPLFFQHSVILSRLPQMLQLHVLVNCSEKH